MKKGLQLFTCLLLSLLAHNYNILAQIAINPIAWSGSGASSTTISNFTTLPGSTTPTSTVVNISQWNRGPGVTYNAAGTSYNSRDWAVGTTSTLASAQAGGNYVYFTVTNNSTTELEVSNILLQTQVSGTGPTKIEMQYCSGTSGDLPFGSAYTVSAFTTPIAASFSPTANIHICAGGTDTFKVYGYGATGAAGTLRINDNTSISASYGTAVTVTASTNAPLCAGSGTALSLTGTGGGGVAYPTGPAYRYSWAGPSGFSSTNGSTGIATPTTGSTGTYTVTVRDYWGCTASATVGVVINAAPAVPTITPTTTAPSFVICSNDSVVFTAPSGTGITYQWRTGGFPGTNIPGATNQSYSARTAGRYRVAVTNAAGCTSVQTPPDSVTVNPAPSAVVTASGPLSFCAGQSVTLSVPSVAGNNYQWYDSTAVISGANSASYTDTISANLHVVVTSAAGCLTTSNAYVLTKVTRPVATTLGDTSFCNGGSVLLRTSVSAGATGIQLQWKRNTVNIPGATTTTYVATTSGLYSAFITIPSSCSIGTNSIDVTVYPLPTPTVTFNGVKFTTQNFYVNYQWYINTITIPGATSKSVVATNNGSYRVFVTDTNGCTKLSDAYGLYNLSVGSVNHIGEVSIYPNPATQLLNIDVEGQFSVSISSIEGKSIAVYNNSRTLDISALPAGLYLVAVRNEEGNTVHVEKLIKN